MNIYILIVVFVFNGSAANLPAQRVVIQFETTSYAACAEAAAKVQQDFHKAADVASCVPKGIYK